jgi:hypothetical protein
MLPKGIYYPSTCHEVNWLSLASLPEIVEAGLTGLPKLMDVSRRMKGCPDASPNILSGSAIT